MKALIQRVTHASVTVDGERLSEIGQGLLILLGVKAGDTQKETEYLAEKTVNLRIFTDDEGKMNRSLLDIDGQALIISQFTLCADCKKGRRPSYTGAAAPDEADQLYQEFIELVRQAGVKKVGEGRFGADMKVELLNDGPVTIMLDTDEIMPKK